MQTIPDADAIDRLEEVLHLRSSKYLGLSISVLLAEVSYGYERAVIEHPIIISIRAFIWSEATVWANPQLRSPFGYNPFKAKPIVRWVSAVRKDEISIHILIPNAATINPVPSAPQIGSAGSIFFGPRPPYIGQPSNLAEVGRQWLGMDDRSVDDTFNEQQDTRDVRATHEDSQGQNRGEQSSRSSDTSSPSSDGTSSPSISPSSGQGRSPNPSGPQFEDTAGSPSSSTASGQGRVVRWGRGAVNAAHSVARHFTPPRTSASQPRRSLHRNSTDSPNASTSLSSSADSLRDPPAHTSPTREVPARSPLRNVILALTPHWLRTPSDRSASTLGPTITNSTTGSSSSDSNNVSQPSLGGSHAMSQSELIRSDGSIRPIPRREPVSPSERVEAPASALDQENIPASRWGRRSQRIWAYRTRKQGGEMGTVSAEDRRTLGDSANSENYGQDDPHLQSRSST